MITVFQIKLIAVVGVAAWMTISLETDLRLPWVTVSYGWGRTSPDGV